MSLFRNFLSARSKDEDCKEQEPQVGFKVLFNAETGEMRVMILGAKQLPTCYGNTKPQGYLIKVTVFPQKEKYETQIVEQSWPTFDEEFKFRIQSVSKYVDSLKGKFISFTAYAILYGEQSIKKNDQNFFSKFISIGGGTKNRGDNRLRKSFRHSLNNRRTVGSVTYNLEMKNFSIRIGNGSTVSTPEIWRSLKEASSAISNNVRDNKKGTVEVTMTYTISEVGNDDLIEITVSKLRCNIQTMEEHERLGGKLYLKIYAFERDDVIQKIKSDKFDPTISLKLEKSSAKLKVKVDERTSEQLKILIKLMCRPLLGQKIQLGRIEIDRRCDVWKEMMNCPMVAVTRVISLQ